MSLHIWCFVVGNACTFSVKIDPAETVDDLKRAIKVETHCTLNAVHTDRLMLYQVALDKSYDKKKRMNELNRFSQHLNECTELDEHQELSVYFDGGPSPGKGYYIIVHISEVKTHEDLDQYINDFLDKCRPAMQELVKKAHDVPSLLPSWKPGPSADQELAKHVSGLCIPIIAGGRPGLLLHALGDEKDSDRIARIQKIFSFAKHTVLLNTSGSGKTRLLLEGLCHRWGFYFVAKRDTTGIGSGDFERVMSKLYDAKYYTKAEITKGADLGPEARYIRELVRKRLAQLVLARFLLLGLLVQEAGEGLQQKEHRHLWVLLQAQPRIFGLGDVFTDLTLLLRGAETRELERRISRKRLELHALLQAVRVPGTNKDATPFFCVLDEVQATVGSPSGRLGELMSKDNKTPRPILREIWISWCKICSHHMGLVLSGTGIELQPLEDDNEEKEYDIVRDIGAFDCRENQIEYIKRYLPAAWNESRWEEFLNRAWRWLRGRYRSTATLITLILEAGYQCPHRTIDEYVKAFTDFRPTDAENWTKTEPQLPFDFKLKTKISTLTFEKMSDPHPETLCNVIHGQILRGSYLESPFSPQEKETFVENGFARHRDGMTVIDEPLATLAAMGWLTSPKFSMSNCLHRDIGKHSPRQNGFEAYLAFYLRHAFEAAPALDAVFTFRNDFAQQGRRDLTWQREEFELVTVVAPVNKNDRQISVLTPSSGSSPNVGLLAESDEQVLQWISTNSDRFTFCFPPASFGPGLLFFVRSKKSRMVLLVMIQAKKYDVVKKQDLIEGVRTVTPEWFWKSNDIKHATADTAPIICDNSADLAASMDDVLKEIPLGLKAKGADYPILRVFASWPGEAWLDRTLEWKENPKQRSKKPKRARLESRADCSEDTDGHPLATLHLENFNKAGTRNLTGSGFKELACP